jgi:asparagine synthase (glutamine-hydrolysing)
MCGIAVAVDWEGAEAAVATLIDGIRHRGDVTDPLVSPRPNTALCTRRLRIVDADGGAQPKLSPDGRVLVAMNGEIYNHADLRRELAALGVPFHSGSDTEVLAAARIASSSRGSPACGVAASEKTLG